LVGNQGGQPILVRDAEPAAGGLEVELPVVDHIAVVDLLEGLVEHPDQAFVQDVEAQDLRRAGARNQAVGRQLDVRVAVVHHPLGDGEHVVLVELQDALEAQALAVVPSQGHRRSGAEAVRVRLPQAVAAGQRRPPGARGPAEIGVIGLDRTDREQQFDQGAVRLDCFTVALEDEIVETAALEGDRAGQGGAVDGNARLLGQGVCPAQGACRLAHGPCRGAGCDFTGRGCRDLGTRLLAGFLGLGGLALLEQRFALRPTDEELVG
jgi:hypothetical protein